MKKITNIQLKKYYKDIKNELVCSEKEKRKILDMLKESIGTYILEHPDATLGALIECFGTPKEIAKAHCEMEDADVIRAKIKMKKIITLSVVGALLIALLIYCSAIALITCDTINEMNGFSTEIILE